MYDKLKANTPVEFWLVSKMKVEKGRKPSYKIENVEQLLTLIFRQIILESGFWDELQSKNPNLLLVGAGGKELL